MENLHYVFENDRAYAMREGKVVASADTIEQLEHKLAMGGAYPGDMGGGFGNEPLPVEPGMESTCPECGAVVTPEGVCTNGECRNSWGGDSHPGHDHMDPHSQGHMIHDPVEIPPPPGGHMMAKTVVTPNGLRGQVLGKVKGTWGDEVTVRFDNGRIVSLPVVEGMTFEGPTQPKVASQTPVEALRGRLASSPDGTKASLVARAQELDLIERSARSRIAKADVHDAAALDEIVSEARFEAKEIDSRLEYLADATPYAAPAPYEMRAYEHGGNRPDSGWLQNTVDDMIAEAEATDYDTLMNEGPEGFVAELPDVAVGDQGITHSMASSFIRGKTAGANPEVRDEFERQWIARVEGLRRDELRGRQDTARKTAAVEQEIVDNATDAGLFL